MTGMQIDGLTSVAHAGKYTLHRMTYIQLAIKNAHLTCILRRRYKLLQFFEVALLLKFNSARKSWSNVENEFVDIFCFAMYEISTVGRFLKAFKSCIEKRIKSVASYT